jgi:hypothetical protein
VKSIRYSARKVAILLALAVSLALPASAFAASTSGTTTENLTVNSTISATFPAATTYGPDGSSGVFPTGVNYETAEGLVTIIGSNNATGVTITAKADVYDGPGAIEVSQTERMGNVSGYSSTGSGASLDPVSGGSLPTGSFATTNTAVTIASSTGPVAGRQVGINWAVAQSNFSVAGEYVSAIHYTASTNP